MSIQSLEADTIARSRKKGASACCLLPALFVTASCLCLYRRRYHYRPALGPAGSVVLPDDWAFQVVLAAVFAVVLRVVVVARAARPLDLAARVLAEHPDAHAVATE